MNAEARAIRLAAADGRADGERIKEVVIFQSLPRIWQQTVQERSGRFVVVILPGPMKNRMATLIPPEIEAANLFECFNEYVAEHSYAPDWRFVSDTHWNEQGNMPGTVCLRGFIEQKSNLSVRSRDGIFEQLHRYYVAFQDGVHPNNWTIPTSTRPQEPAAIDRLPEQFYGGEWVGGLFHFPAVDASRRVD